MLGSPEAFRRSLLDWFDGQKRPLPWREDPSLYKTVVSEFMLQQTQVETVKPFFLRWLEAFPDFQSLARADEAAVLKHWEGLGYYSRARNLHKLARSIVEEGVPGSPGLWRRRPGVGPYTAAAIASIAQNAPEPVIDGNVIRVLTRLANDPFPLPSSTVARRRLLPLATRLIDPARPGAWNEALMELGATICRKTRPACLLCPVRSHCRAHAAGTEESLPVIPRKASRQRVVHRLWLRKEDVLLLTVYPDSARRLAGLAELPTLPEKPSEPPVLSRSRGISSERIREHIHALPAGSPLTKACLADPQTRWIPLARLPQTALSAPHKRWIQELINKLG
jgi:A/G-specific adenine glycosylase